MTKSLNRSGDTITELQQVVGAWFDVRCRRTVEEPRNLICGTSCGVIGEDGLLRVGYWPVNVVRMY